MTPPDSDRIIYLNVPDVFLFTPAYYKSLNDILMKVPEALTIRFIISSVSRQVKHTIHSPQFDDSRCNVCVIDVSTTPGVGHTHRGLFGVSLAERITEVMYLRLKQDLVTH